MSSVFIPPSERRTFSPFQSRPRARPKHQTASGQTPHRDHHVFSLGFVTAVALIFLGLILRSPLTAVSPIVQQLRSGFGIDSTTIGLMTSIPVLCFGLVTPIASWVIGKNTVEAAIFITLIGALIGLVLRSTGGIEISMIGTVVIGASLTVGNIVSLMVIARDFPLHNRLMTGIYTSALNVGTMLTTAITAPIALWLGWRVGLASSAVLVLPAIALWLRVVRRRRNIPPAPVAAHPALTATGAPVPLWKRPLVWLLVVAFATHLTVYYSLTAWLPDYFIDATGMRATTAGVIAALFQILALLGSFGAPLAAKKVPFSWLLVVVAGCWIITPLGFWLAPHGFVMWSVLGGIASGGGFTVIFVLIMGHARDLQDNRRINAAVQGGGYTLSAMGPILVGHLHQVTGAWGSGFLLMTAAALIMCACGLAVTRVK